MAEEVEAEPVRLSLAQLRRLEQVLLRCFSPALAREVAMAIHDELAGLGGRRRVTARRAGGYDGPWWPGTDSSESSDAG